MNEHSGFGDAEAKRILERAAEIDADAQKTLDAAALRAIANEAGISTAAVDAALAEHLRPRPTVAARLMQRRGLLIGAALLAALILSRLFP
jgi:hypothetical protein